uniref:Uncharacterized protein n=1 Tax=Tetranychus urticae TaxID=32264 RepID=T1JVW5_TETUR
MEINLIQVSSQLCLSTFCKYQDSLDDFNQEHKNLNGIREPMITDGFKSRLLDIPTSIDQC